MRRMIVKSLIGFLCVSAIVAGPAVAAAGGSEVATQTQAQTQTPRVDLNTASIEELMELPGVGKTVAERIVAYRESNGPFQKKEELMNVRGIGEKTFLKLEPMIQVSTESPKK